MQMSENTKKLIDTWLTYKYWESCCLDEAIDWSNHQGNYQLTPDEMEEFMAWRDAMKKIMITAVCKACHPDLKENMRTPLNMPVISRKDKFGLPMAGRNQMECATAHGRVCQPL